MNGLRASIGFLSTAALDTDSAIRDCVGNQGRLLTVREAVPP